MDDDARRRSTHQPAIFRKPALAICAISMLCLLPGCSSQAREEAPVAHVPEQFRLWCAKPEGYYPSVRQCPGGWEHRVPESAASAVSPPLLIIPVEPPSQEK